MNTKTQELISRVTATILATLIVAIGVFALFGIVKVAKYIRSDNFQPFKSKESAAATLARKSNLLTMPVPTNFLITNNIFIGDTNLVGITTYEAMPTNEPTYEDVATLTFRYQNPAGFHVSRIVWTNEEGGTLTWTKSAKP